MWFLEQYAYYVDACILKSLQSHVLYEQLNLNERILYYFSSWLEKKPFLNLKALEHLDK